MEARDTIMSEEQLKEAERDYMNEDYSVNAIRLVRGHTEDLMLRVAQAQAEISFKAGIREVLEWLKDRLEGGDFMAYFLEQDFKAQGRM